MFSFSPHQRYFLYQTVTDMRKGINGLNGLIREYLKQDPMSGDVFIFLNKRRDRIKLLMWDRTGYAMYYKQLERGTFELPGSGKMGGLELSWTELAMLMDGIELGSIKRRKRYIKVA